MLRKVVAAISGDSMAFTDVVLPENETCSPLVARIALFASVTRRSPIICPGEKSQATAGKEHAGHYSSRPCIQQTFKKWT